MSLLSYNRLIQLIEEGVITADPANVNGTSIDITLGDVLLLEAKQIHIKEVDLQAKQNIDTDEYVMDEHGYLLVPGEFVLASSAEVFNLPANISAEYKLKSSMARNGLEHLNAGWCDPGWHGSTLTLEFKNMTHNHHLLIRPGMKIGQVTFWESEPVPENRSYAVTGQYNNQTTTQASKGIR